MENMAKTPELKKAKTRSIVTGLLLSLALLFILNLVSAFVFYRLDLSKGKIHTLSKTSKNLVRKLDDNVVVKVYLSDNLPAEYNVLARYAKDLLSEYKLYGGNHFRYEIVPQTNLDEFQGQASRDNIFAQRVMILENDQQTVRDVYTGIAFEYKGNRESINLTQDIEGRLEYEITSLLRRLTKASLPRVTVFEDSLYNGEYYKYFEHHTIQNYSIVPTNLNAPLMATDVMVFPGVADSLSQIQLFNLDQFIMHGGKVIILQDRVVGLVQYGNASYINSNLFNLLEHYGIRIKPNLVLDQKCAPINMSQRSGIFVVDVPLPFPPIPTLDGMKTSEISKGLSDILLYLGSEIDTNPGKKGLIVKPILQTSAASGIMDGPEFDISPERFIGDKVLSTLTHPPLTVAAEFTGAFSSYFAGRKGVEGTPGFVSQTDNGQVIVVSDSDLIRDFIASASSANMMFILNAIDYLLKDTSLNEVRSRTIPNSPLDIKLWLYNQSVDAERTAKIEPVIRQSVKFANLILPSILLVLLGLRRLFRLKKSRRLINERFRLESLPYEPAKASKEEDNA
jgi:gliding-associated putative ABC transporter substrate-binding component GldG